jgi:hypothetical protein
MSNIHYDNQKLYCTTNKLPMFASSSCNHTYGWVRDERHGNLQTLSEMLIEKHGHDEAFVISSSTHIISCPICNRSWCD